jgi:ribonuclease R
MSLRENLFKILESKDYIPLAAGDLADKLNIRGKVRQSFDRLIREELSRGGLVRLKGDRLCLPRDADLISGIIKFRQSGAALLIPDKGPDGQTQDPITVRAEDTWVAMHNDHVVCRLQRPRPVFDRRSRKGGGRRRPEPVQPERLEGRVIRILKRAREIITGTLQQSRLYWYVIPGDPRIIQDILVPQPGTKGTPAAEVDDKVVVKLHEWEQRHLNPEGEIIEVLGKTHEPMAEYKSILYQYNLDPEFPVAVLNEVDELPKTVQAEEKRGRLDITQLHTFTIDPDDAKDFDDALSVERLEGGNVRIGVHIADVSAYVRSGTSLDNEARKRGNSTYLVGTVIPMLPHALSNGLCSLVEAEDRLTKSVFLTFNSRGSITETSFARTVIRSSKRLTYRQAYAFLKKEDLKEVQATPLPPAHQTGSTGRPLSDLADSELQLLQKDIRLLWKIASRLRSQRMSKGSLDFDMPETKIFVDAQGYADRIEKIENDESHQLIEEFMLCANEAVGKVLKDNNLPAIYRTHADPDEDKLNELREFLATVGIEVGNLTQRREVTKMLKLIGQHPQAYTLRIQFLRSLKQACYRASADGHYGLYKQNYAHFTSPIRRYADLIVHRVFDRYLQKHGIPSAPKDLDRAYTQGELESLADHISITEQNSTEAERESVKTKLLEFFEREVTKKNKSVFKAVIMEIKNHGMFVELNESQAYGLIHLSTLKDDLYNVTADGSQLIGRKKKRTFTVGQVVEVVTHKVDRFKRQIDFAVNEAKA